MTPGPQALWHALDKLYIDFLVVILIAGLATGVDALAVHLSKPAPADAPPPDSLGVRAISNFGCALLGLALAYFAAQGLSETSNSTLTGLATGLTALITAGIALFETRGQPAASVLRTGAASFLITAILCYETLNAQSGHFHS